MLKTCNLCRKELALNFFSKDKGTKDGLANRCSPCKKESRDKKQGRSGRKNINNLHDANKWLKENFPNYSIIQWNGKEKSLILDKCRNVEFEYVFSRFKEKIKLNPDRTFSASKQELRSKIRKSFKEKYGVEHALQVVEFKQKQKITTENRYGTDNVFKSEEIKNKIKQTNIEKYGVENPLQNQIIREKVKNTTKENLGVEYPFQNQEIKQNMLKNNKEKFGGPSPMSSLKIRKKVKETRIDKGLTTIIDGKTIPEWSQRKDTASQTTLSKYCKHGKNHPLNFKPRRSGLEVLVGNFLKEIKVHFIFNKLLPEHINLKKNEGRKFPDFLLPKYSLIIECDGEYYHQDMKKDENRNKIYTDLGYNLLVLKEKEIKNNFDYVKEKIINKIKEISKLKVQ